MTAIITGAALLTPGELGTLGGAVTAVFILTNSLRSVFNWNPKVVGLLLSFLVAFFGVWVLNDHSLPAWVVAIPNGALIYSSAAGMASISNAGHFLSKADERSRQISGSAESNTRNFAEEISGTKTFWRPWF